MFQIKWLWKNLEGKRVLYIFSMFLNIISVGMFILSPLIIQLIVDNIVIGVSTSTGEVIRRIDWLIPLVAAVIIFSIIRTSLFYIVFITFENISQHVIYNIRNYIFDNISKQDDSFFKKFRTGDLMARFTGDLDMVRHTIAWVVRIIIESIIMFFATIIYFFTVNVVFTLVMLIVTPVLFFATISFIKKSGPRYEKLREELSKLNNKAQENISGNRVVKAFANEEHEKKHFREANRKYKEANKEATFVWLNHYPIIESLAQSLSFITLLVGGYFVIKNKITFGQFLAFSSLSWTITTPIRNLGILLNDIQRFLTSSAKIIDVYYERTTIVSNENQEKEIKYGEISLNNINLHINKAKIIDNINLKIKAGSTVAIMGPTGCGKTTLINMIARFYDCSSGAIEIDKINIKDYNLQSLRKNIAIATQDIFLFSDTAEGNIAYGAKNITNHEVKKYAEISAAKFIENMPQGYETIIGERGVGLSGGQKQRIALARALSTRPKILILDDTTSALDVKTEKIIQKNLENLDFKCTKLIITQRIITAKQADLIIIMDKGKIIEQGTHEQLLNKKQYYYDIFKMQNQSVFER